MPFGGFLLFILRRECSTGGAIEEKLWDWTDPVLLFFFFTPELSTECIPTNCRVSDEEGVSILDLVVSSIPRYRSRSTGDLSSDLSFLISITVYFAFSWLPRFFSAILNPPESRQIL